MVKALGNVAFQTSSPCTRTYSSFAFCTNAPHPPDPASLPRLPLPLLLSLLSLRTLLWFAYLLWPYIGFGIFSSILAQFLLATVSQEHVEQGSFLTMLDVKDYPDLKIGHGFIGSILGFSIGGEGGRGGGGRGGYGGRFFWKFS